MGMQFNWIFRYPGEDGKLGARDFREITGSNPIGQIWTDPKNLDDLQPSDMVLPKGQKVRVRILSRDVLHSFFLPQDRKSTRLNSSHVAISYAVFCLK